MQKWQAAIVFIACGAGVMFWARHQLRAALDSKNWLTTQGKITYSAIEEGDHPADTANYSANVAYSYHVAAKPYIGTAITHATLSESLKAAKKRLAAYPLDATVTVYYNPHNPEESVLVAGMNEVTLGLPVIGLALFISGLIILFV